MPVDTLMNMALRRLGPLIRDIHDFGEVPIRLIEGVLPKITNPDQLRQLEQRSPQIVGHTRDIWLNMLKRDIPYWKERLPPDWQHTIFGQENATKWHKVYFKLRKDVEAEKEKSRAALLQGLQKQAAERGPEAMVRDREPLHLQDKKRLRKSYADASYSMNSGMYTKTKGETFFEKVKRSAVTKATSKRMGRANGLKPVQQRVIKRAPLGMVEDIKDSRDTVVNNVGLPPPGSTASSSRPQQRDRPAPTPSNINVTRLTADFLEDYDDDDDFNDGKTGDKSDHDSDDELFGISTKPKTTNTTSTTKIATTRAPPPRRKALSPPSRPMRAAPSLALAHATARAESPARTGQASYQPQAASKGLGPINNPKVVKRTKPPRSIFAKK